MSGQFWKARATYHCYHDCEIGGCPGHTITLREKHGGLTVSFLAADGTVTREAELPFDHHFYYALAKILSEGDATP